MNTGDNNLKISVCIPYYNCSAFIDECLGSVIKQTYKNWEIIVFNDGSNSTEYKLLEQSIDALRTHFTNSQTIQVINSENVGLVAARCAMWKAATGDIVINLDSDDYLFSMEALQKIADCFNSSKTTSLVKNNATNGHKSSIEMVLYNTTRSVDASLNKDFSRLINRSQNLGDNIFLSNLDDVRHDFCCFDQINNIWIKAVPRDILLEAICNEEGDFSRNINMTEDIYLSTFILNRFKPSGQIAVINEPLYFYRVNEKSTVFAKFDQKRLNDQIFVQKNLEDYAQRWKVQGFIAEKHTLEYLLYGDMMYIQLSDVSSDEKVAAYKRLSSNKFISERLQKAVNSKAIMKSIPRHKRISLKMFAAGHYKRLLAYFSGLEKLKSLKK